MASMEVDLGERIQPARRTVESGRRDLKEWDFEWIDASIKGGGSKKLFDMRQRAVAAGARGRIGSAARISTPIVRGRNPLVRVRPHQRP